MRKINNSRVLRQLAEGLFERFAGDDGFPRMERADFGTSLVRQWITYDGSAAFFRGDRQLYLVLGRTPLGKPIALPEPGPSEWPKFWVRDWKIDPDDLPDLIDQLNVGQSAEVVNGESAARPSTPCRRLRFARRSHAPNARRSCRHGGTVSGSRPARSAATPSGSPDDVDPCPGSG